MRTFRQLNITSAQTMGLEAARGAAYSMAAMTDSKPAPAGSGEQISSTLGNLSVAELYEIMAQMKGLVQQNPPQVRSQQRQLRIALTWFWHAWCWNLSSCLSWYELRPQRCAACSAWAIPLQWVLSLQALRPRSDEVGCAEQVCAQQARQVLVQNPQLTKALFQAQIMLGMVKNAPQVHTPPALSPIATPCPLMRPCRWEYPLCVQHPAVVKSFMKHSFPF